MESPEGLASDQGPEFSASTAVARPPSVRSRLRRILLGVIAALYVVSIPWYRETGAATDSTWGLPNWVAFALGCYVLVAIANAAAWLLTDVPDELPNETPASFQSPDDGVHG